VSTIRAVFQGWSLRLRYFTSSLDPTLLAVLGALGVVGLITLYSAAHDHPGNHFSGQLRNFVLAFVVMLFFASLPPRILMRMAIPVYVVGVVSLLAVLAVGVSAKGAQRWLNLGFTRVQPAEIMKLGVPLMLAWYFDRRAGVIRTRDFLFAALLVLVPVALIAKQPDLGTALLVLAAGFFVIFFAGLPWRWLITLLVLSMAAMPVVWSVLHDYQRNRVLTLLDPSKDPLGKGFHTLQSMIAIGSGGVLGKGWMNGTQTHLEFIPERTTDFIFAVFSEEFGLIGNIILVGLFLILVARGLAIAGNAATPFTRLLGGSIAMILFTYAFVNMGMVSGILPVVGVPLPLISYGGTALVTIGMACGMLMTIQRHRTLVQS
jgi:rod shape determining protein RodA